jgi:hypothetical protein
VQRTLRHLGIGEQFVQPHLKTSFHRPCPSRGFRPLKDFYTKALRFSKETDTIELPRFGFFAFCALAVVCGAAVGGHGGILTRWCAAMAASVGAIGFALGFVGPILFQPDSPQGPLLGIFVTGPFGVIAGSLLGFVIGVIREHRSN